MADEEPKGSKGKKWLGCCCGGLVLVAILCAGGAYWGGSYLKAFLPEILAEELNRIAESSGLPQEQIDALKAEVERLRAGIEDGKVDWEEFGEFFNNYDDEPLFALVAVQAFDMGVLEPSELPPEEKETARRSVHRFARGLDEGSIPLYRAYDLFGVERSQDFGGGNVEIRVETSENPWETLDGIRSTVAEAKRFADEAGVPDEPYTLDVASHFAGVVDDLVD